MKYSADWTVRGVRLIPFMQKIYFALLLRKGWQEIIFDGKELYLILYVQN